MTDNFDLDAEWGDWLETTFDPDLYAARRTAHFYDGDSPWDTLEEMNGDK